MNAIMYQKSAQNDDHKVTIKEKVSERDQRDETDFNRFKPH